ncbi:hypothetical protein K2X89_06820 [Myxococcota bacterium]|nr:hypothetical protein [Myxococcota bacterium]
MSDERASDEGKGRATEELDALWSARRDGALDADGVARLEALLAGSEEARGRALALESVDAKLRRLAANPIPEARLDRIEAALGRRLARERGDAAGAFRSTPSSVAPRPSPSSRRRFVGVGLAAALAAGILLAAILWTPRDEPPADTLARLDETRAVEPPDDGMAIVERGLEDPDEPDDLAALGIAEASDLEVIEELELLEFLAARERSEGEPRG